MRKKGRWLQRMLRILHVIGAMGSGGAEAMLMNLYRAVDRTCIQFDFVVHTEQKAFYDDEIESLGGHIYRTQRFNGANLLIYRRFWNAFFEEHPEYSIVHGHINSSAAIYLSIAKKHGCVAVVHSHATRNQEKSLRAYAFFAFAYPIRYIADYFFACSRQAGLDRFGEQVVSSQKFEVLNNGIKASDYVFDATIRAKVRKRYGLADDTLIVGHVGRFTFAKNHDFLIDIFQEIHQMQPNSKLWLVGTGELENEIREKVNRLSLSDVVVFVGQTKDVCEYLQAMDVFVFPSVFEGLGIALVEAQAAGLPCIVSENIQSEANIGCGLVKTLNISEGSHKWAKEALQSKSVDRVDTSPNVLQAGLDIEKTAHYLQMFYEKVAQSKPQNK